MTAPDDRTVLAAASWLFLACAAVTAFLVTRARMRRRGRLPRASFRDRLAAQCREVFGTPFSIPGDGEPLDDGEKRVLARYVIAEQEKAPLAAEPERARRQP